MNHTRNRCVLSFSGLILFFIFLNLAAASQTGPISTSAKADTVAPTATKTEAAALTTYADNLVQLINAVRQEKGVEPLVSDPNLQYAAAQQAAYLLKTGFLSEKGEGGASAKSLATDFGYGGGAPFLLRQVIAMSQINTRPETILKTVWLANTKYKAALLDKDKVHIGAAVAADGRRRFIVVYLAALNDRSPVYTALPTYDIRTPRPEKSATPSLIPLQQSTANPDGSIFHPVQKGETLSEIALAYGVNWDNLSLLNKLDLKNPVILEGQKLVIRPKFTATMTPTITNTPRPPTRTPRPTFTMDASAATSNKINTSITPPVAETAAAKPEQDLLFAGRSRKFFALGLIAISLLGLFLTLFVKRHKK